MATSGIFTGARGGGTSNGPYLTLAWSRIATDISNNKSQIRLTLNLNVDYSINFSASKTGVLQGTSFTYTSGYSGTSTKALKTVDVWVTHKSDGSLTTTFSASFDIGIVYGGVTINSMSVSGSATIDTIPRASDFTAFSLSNSTLNYNTAVTVNYTLGRKDSSLSQDMVLKIGSSTIKSWNTTGTGALTQALSTAEVNSIISKLPNTTSGTLTLEMQTKNGTTKIGSVVSRTASITLNAAIIPTATALTVAIAGTGRDKTIAQYIQGISKVTSSFTRTAGYGATISSSTIVVKRQSDGGNSQTIASNSGTTANALSLSGVYSVTATVTDSRGRKATVSTTITVAAYLAPTITKFTCARDATTSTTVKATINIAWAVLGTNNPTNITIVGKNNAGVSQNLYTLNSSTTGLLNTTQSYTGQADMNSFTYTITITDSFGKVATMVSKVSTTFVELTIAKGKGIGVGKVHQNGALDVRGDVHIDGTIKLPSSKYLIDGGGIDLNNSDLIGANGIYFNDECGSSEGLFFPKAGVAADSPTRTDYDVLRVANGVVYINDDVVYADSGWIDLTMANGWIVYSGANPVRVRKVGSVVTIVGCVSPPANNTLGTTSDAHTMFSLPSGYRPSQDNISAIMQGTTRHHWRISVTTGGSVQASRMTNTQGTTTANPDVGYWMPFYLTFLVN